MITCDIVHCYLEVVGLRLLWLANQINDAWLEKECLKWQTEKRREESKMAIEQTMRQKYEWIIYIFSIFYSFTLYYFLFFTLFDSDRKGRGWHSALNRTLSHCRKSSASMHGMCSIRWATDVPFKFVFKVVLLPLVSLCNLTKSSEGALCQSLALEQAVLWSEVCCYYDLF